MKLLAALSLIASASAANLPSTCTQPKQVALTFDDGPSPNTKAVLTILRRENVKATFHVSVGLLSNLAQQEHVRKARDDGHLIGLRFDAKMTLQELEAMSLQQLREKLDGESRALHAVTGVYPRFIRLPFGFRAMDSTLHRRIEELGYIPTLWTVDSHDYTQITPDEMFRETYDVPFRAGEFDKGIILQRDLFDIAGVVERGIQHLKGKGMNFVNLGECVGNEFVYKTDLEGRGSFVTMAGATFIEEETSNANTNTNTNTNTTTTTTNTATNTNTNTNTNVNSNENTTTLAEEEEENEEAGESEEEEEYYSDDEDDVNDREVDDEALPQPASDSATSVQASSTVIAILAAALVL